MHGVQITVGYYFLFVNTNHDCTFFNFHINVWGR